MKLMKRLLSGISSLALLGLGATGASAALSQNAEPIDSTPPLQMGPQIGAAELELSESLFLVRQDGEPGVQVASRFKGPGDTGRPDIFGPPGRPAIGAPGQSGY